MTDVHHLVQNPNHSRLDQGIQGIKIRLLMARPLLIELIPRTGVS